MVDQVYNEIDTLLSHLTSAAIAFVASASETLPVTQKACELCLSMARFLRDLLSYMNRGKVFSLIRNVLLALHTAVKVPRKEVLAELRLLIVRVVRQRCFLCVTSAA